MTLLVLVAAIGAGLAPVARELHRARRQRQAADMVRSLGGRLEAWPSEPDGTAAGWLRIFLGDRYFADVHSVYLKLSREEHLDLFEI